MGTYEELLKRYYKNASDFSQTMGEFEKESQEVERVRKIAENTENILNNLDEQFCKATKLSKLDMEFLFVAIGLQIIRQYLLTKFPERLDDKTAAASTWGHREEHSNRIHRYYNPSLEEIISNPVPFDANIGANGALSGAGKLGHRVKAIGHDPILGLVFGTANIATSTLTTSDLVSYHIYTNENKRDYFKSRAQTHLVLSKTAEKVVSGGCEGKVIVATSLLKELVHLRSDLYTKNSLPIPIVSVIDPKKASLLANYGFDMANVVTVGKQASYAIFINTMIAMIHRLFFDGKTDEKMYEVRTRKILMYSNAVATSSNLMVVAATRDMKHLDLGGLAVTITRLITDTKFIREVKQEFIFGRYKDLLMG